MKRNVDLTENRDFQRKNYQTNSSFSEPEIHDFGLVLTGDRETRAGKRMEITFGSADNNCDCCGTTNPLKFIGKSSLCIDCLKKLEAEKIWWKK